MAVSLSSSSKRPKENNWYPLRVYSSNLLLGCRRVSHSGCFALVTAYVSKLGGKGWGRGALCGRNPWVKGTADVVLEDESYERLGVRFGSVEMQDMRIAGIMGRQGRPGHCCCAWPVSRWLKSCDI